MSELGEEFRQDWTGSASDPRSGAGGRSRPVRPPWQWWDRGEATAILVRTPATIRAIASPTLQCFPAAAIRRTRRPVGPAAWCTSPRAAHARQISAAPRASRVPAHPVRACSGCPRRGPLPAAERGAVRQRQRLCAPATTAATGVDRAAASGRPQVRDGRRSAPATYATWSCRSGLSTRSWTPFAWPAAASSASP